LFTSQRNHRRAAEAYADALNLDERWPGLLHVFALACYRSGRYANVESAARRWIAMAPSADAWDTLSCALRAQGKAAEALSAAETALKLAPDHVQAQHSKGAALLRLGRQEEALVLFEALSELGVNAPALFLYRGQVLQGLNRVQEAAEVFLAGLAAAPSSVALQHAYTSVKPN
jgi:tetratricopeptide (TPR) repeat protein